MEVAGTTALITGATGGLGRAISLAMATRGSRLVLTGRSGDALIALADELPGEGHRVIPADLSEPGAAERLAGEAGEVDILVANAALPGTGRLDELTPEQAKRALRVNLEAPIMLAQAVIGPMQEKGRGQVVLVSSLSGKAASPRSSIYNATKFGLRGFGFALRTDLHGTGVGVSLVLPGMIRDAGMFADSGAKAPAVLGTATSDQVAEAVIDAIVNDRMEVGVAPVSARLLSHAGLVAPRLAMRVQLSDTGQKVAQAIADGQVDKR